MLYSKSFSFFIKHFITGILITFVCLLHVRHVSFAQSTVSNPATTQVVVKLNPLGSATIAAINITYGTTTIKPLISSVGIYLLQVPTGTTAATIAGKMAGDLRLLYAEPNFISQVAEGVARNSWLWGGADATPLATQYASQLLGLSGAQKISKGAGAVVAVLDRGVQLNHPALAAFWSSKRYDFVGNDTTPSDEANGIDEDDDGIVDNAYGHGTHIAGIIHLIAPAAKIMPIRVLDTEARTDIFRLAEAIIYATDQGANVINLSLGTSDKSALLEEVIRRATQRGVIVVAAAGNLNSKNRQYPAGNNCVIAVSALNAQKVKADFANYGSWVDFTAPGVSIYSALPNSGYGWWSGTSMATPFVAAQAALLYSAKPTLPIRQRIELMAATARSVDGSNPNYKGQMGVGLPALDISLQRLISGSLPQKSIISGSCTDPLVAAAAEVSEAAEVTEAAENDFAIEQEVSVIEVSTEDIVVEQSDSEQSSPDQPVVEDTPTEQPPPTPLTNETIATDEANQDEANQQRLFLPMVVR